MPYTITTGLAACNGFAVVKDNDDEIMGCHKSESQAERQMAALYAAEDGGDDVGDNNDDLDDNYDGPIHKMSDGTVMKGASHGRQNLAIWEHRADPPASPSEQIKGSSVNKPGSASGKSGDISINAATEKALQNKATAHNDQMTENDRPSWTRVRVGALRSVYRRGSGAFSSSNRPGIGRAQWSMARVNAFLFLASSGAPKNPKYITDNDLLNSDHPRFSKQERAISYTPTQAMIDEAKRGLEWRREFNRGGTEVGVARARDISNGRPLSLETVNRSASFFARHEVDKQGQGFTKDEDGYPSAGRIAWALWGGDPGRTFVENIQRMTRETPNRELAQEILANVSYTD